MDDMTNQCCIYYYGYLNYDTYDIKITLRKEKR